MIFLNDIDGSENRFRLETAMGKGGKWLPKVDLLNKE